MATTIEYNIKVNDQGALTSIGAMEDELAKLNDEIKEVDVNSQAFADLATKIGTVEAQLEGAQAGLARFTAEDKVKAFQGSIDVLGGSIAGVTGAVGLLGVESEEFDKLTARAASAIAFASGIKQASDGAIALSQSLSKSSKAQKLFAAASQLASTGLGKFKIALAATGIGALVVGVGLLVANFDKVTAAVTKFIGKSKFLTGIVDTAKAAFDSFINSIRPALEFLGLLPDEAERAEIATRELAATTATESEKQLQLLQARGASAKEIYDEEIRLIDAKIAATEDETEAADLAFQKQLVIAKEEKRLADEKAAREKAAADKRKADKEAADAEAEAELQKAKDAEQARLDGIASILADYQEKQRDLEAQTNLQKVELEELRKLEDLDRLNATEAEKQAIRDYYSQLKVDAAQKDADAQLAIDEKLKEDEKKNREEAIQNEIAQNEVRLAALNGFASGLSAIAGDNKELQIAAVIAQQAASIGQIVSATGAANAKAVAAFPLTFGQPWVTINTISAGLSIAGAVASAAKAIQQIKSTAGKGGGGGSAASPSQVPRGAAGGGGTPESPFEQFTPAGTSPEALGGQQTVRAYVIGGDVTSTQEADAKINNRRSLAG